MFFDAGPAFKFKSSGTMKNVVIACGTGGHLTRAARPRLLRKRVSHLLFTSQKEDSRLASKYGKISFVSMPENLFATVWSFSLAGFLRSFIGSPRVFVQWERIYWLDLVVFPPLGQRLQLDL